MREFMWVYFTKPKVTYNFKSIIMIALIFKNPYIKHINHYADFGALVDLRFLTYLLRHGFLKL